MLLSIDTSYSLVKFYEIYVRGGFQFPCIETLVYKWNIVFLLNSTWCLRQPHLFTSFYTGFPRYFAPYLSSYTSSYSTRRSQSGGNFLVIPKFYPSVHKSIKQFRYSFDFDAPTVWNALPDEIRASPFLASFRKQLKTYLYTKAYPP